MQLRNAIVSTAGPYLHLSQTLSSLPSQTLCALQHALPA